MTREEVIKRLIDLGSIIVSKNEEDKKYCHAIKLAIKALEQPDLTADQIHTMKEQEYMRGYEDGRKVERESWDEMLVMCDNCGHAIHVKREDVKKPEPCNLPQLGATYEDGDELDEVIRHCDEIVQDITWFCNSPSKYIEQRRHESAVKLRQLASWLRELKRLRTEVYFLKAEKENEPVDLLGDVPCKTCKWRVATTEKCEECIDGVSDNYEVQEPCEDCVSRQAAIDAALSAFSRGLLASPDIRKLPSVQPEPQWIPVSKKSHPDTPERVQVQLDNGWIITAYYEENEWLSVPYCDEPIEDRWIEAWMPLPEPYRVERRTDETD